MGIPLDILACPAHRATLGQTGDHLVCPEGHGFEVEQGIPVFSNAPRREAVPHNMAPVSAGGDVDPKIDPFVSNWIVNTNGNLYWSVRGKLSRYPIPRWPFPPGKGKRVLDVGCSWGRWSVAAARADYNAIGLDVHLDSLIAARRVSGQLGVRALFVCGDADALPLRSESMDVVFSYSVLQHLERPTVARFLGEAARVLKPGGVCLIQLPNRFGLASFLQQLKRGMREAKPGTFEMRYWSRGEIRKGMAEAGFKWAKISADGFLSQNARKSDMDMLSPAGKLIVLISEAGRRAADILPAFVYVADSLWIESRTGAGSDRGLGA